jgi:hypothetical protein
LTFGRLTIPTQIALHGLRDSGRGVTEAGQAFFSVLCNRDWATLPPEAHRALDTLLAAIMSDQAGIVSHDHFLYVVRPSVSAA